MVVLSRIYTKTGDKGTTALGDGRRVRKDHPRIEAFGTVDELNASLGVVLAVDIDHQSAELLHAIQNDLFDLGADLCVPEQSPRRTARSGKGAKAKSARTAPLRITEAHVRPLEAAIDRLNAPLPALRSFVLPGGSNAAARLHMARTICRRAERATVALSKREKVNPQAIIYLNRLSDLLFVMARRANARGEGDRLWVPGGRSAKG